MSKSGKRSLTAAELQSMIASELTGAIEPDAVVIVCVQSGWQATVRGNGARLDEGLAAAVCETSRRLASHYSLLRE